MTNSVSIFQNNNLLDPNRFAGKDYNNNLVGNSLDYARISLNGNKFREIIDGEQRAISDSDSLDVVILDAAPTSRQYYEGVYSPNNPAPPNCWSSDCNIPDPDVKAPQASSCDRCPMNAKGSGANGTRACRFSQRIAVMIYGDENERVYQMQLPAMSIFGKSDHPDKLPMRSYAKYLQDNGNGAPIHVFVTKMRFDPESSVPKLFFSPVKVLDNEEFAKVEALREHPDVSRCLSLNFTAMEANEAEQTGSPDVTADNTSPPWTPAPVEAPAKKAAPVKKAVPAETPAQVKATPASSDDIQDVLDGWD